MKTSRRGLILPVVLFVLLLLGLLVARFAFRVNADLATVQASAYRQQTRLAAEAGIEGAKMLLAADRLNMARWYDNPDELHRIVIWSAEGDSTVWGTNEEFDDGTMTYRFSLVADDPTDDEEFVRFGLTDESSKLNLNLATEAQLMTLMTRLFPDDTEMNPAEIVGAILDWRDADSDPRTEEADTEDLYYRELAQPYLVKNGPFDTVEELLLVKGVTGQILYGEDFDRNGLITLNEDDGDASFPPDDEDGELDLGLYPYLTVVSQESNVDNDNRPRIYLYGDEATVRADLTLLFEEEPSIVDYIVTASRAGAGRAGGGAAGSENETTPGDQGERDMGSPPSVGDEEVDQAVREALDNFGAKDGPRSQVAPEDSGKDDPPDDGAAEPEDAGAEPEGELGEGDAAEDEDEETPASAESTRMRSPADLLFDSGDLDETLRSPVRPEHLATLMNHTTVVPPEQQVIPGLININTATPPVLACIEGLSGEQIGAILEARGTLEADEKETTAWLVTQEVVDLETYRQIAPAITARGQQFTIQALGYADHVGMVTRLEVVVDMLGPIAQVIYYRDITHLGGHFPIREEDKEAIRDR